MKIYIVQHKVTMIIHGCFDTKKKATNYISIYNPITGKNIILSDLYQILPLDVQ